MTEPQTNRWLILTGGRAPELDVGITQDEVVRFLERSKGPDALWTELFLSLAGRALNSEVTCLQKDVLERNPLTAKVCLTVRRETDDPAVGITGNILEWEGTTAHPVIHRWETFGLPNMLLMWEYEYRKWGQCGFCEFRHCDLKAMFRTEQVLCQFGQLWERVFGVPPEWTSEEALTI